jgi:hypothetical protein
LKRIEQNKKNIQKIIKEEGGKSILVVDNQSKIKNKIDDNQKSIFISNNKSILIQKRNSVGNNNRTLFDINAKFIDEVDDLKVALES